MRKVICICSLIIVSLILVACDISRTMFSTSISNEHQVTSSHSSDSGKSDVAKLDSENQTELLKKQAEILTTHIIEKALLPFDESASLTTLSDREIFNFLATIYSFHEETTHPYLQYALLVNNPYPVVCIKSTDAQMLVHQLFGVSDWAFEAPDCYNEELQEYCFSLEAGSPNSPYSCRIYTASAEESNIVVDFNLIDTVDYIEATSESLQEYGDFQMEFEILYENGAAFLRFRELRPN